MLQMGYMGEGPNGPPNQYMLGGGQGAGQMTGGDPGMPHMGGMANGDG